MIKAASTDRRNIRVHGGAREAVERVRGGLTVERLARPSVEGKRDGCEFLFPVDAQVRAFRELLPYQHTLV